MEWPEITTDTPIEEVKRIHQKIWDYAIKHEEKPETPYKCDCAACEYVKQSCVERFDCQFCPIIWPKNAKGNQVCDKEGGLYVLWDLACWDAKFRNGDPQKSTELAHQIRDLPWKFETEKE